MASCSYFLDDKLAPAQGRLCVTVHITNTWKTKRLLDQSTFFSDYVFLHATAEVLRHVSNSFSYLDTYGINPEASYNHIEINAVNS